MSVVIASSIANFPNVPHRQEHICTGRNFALLTTVTPLTTRLGKSGQLRLIVERS
ncbi:MAG TPA: hypothetical protein V6D09_10120 [Leptolyngbyaceae cyanobacterium]